MELIDKQELIIEGRHTLKSLLNDKKECLSFANSVINGENLEYAINGFSVYSKKYGLNGLLDGISYELDDYIEKCDDLSFNGKKREFRKYLVKPYLSDPTFQLLEDFIDYTSYMYKFDAYVLWTKFDAPLKTVTIKSGIKRKLDYITDLFYSYDFVPVLEDSISNFDTNTLEEHKKI